MTPATARRQIVTEALRQWDLEPWALKLRHEGENTVYVLRTPERRLIVRLSGAELQSPVTLRGEMGFIDRCVQAGIHAARPIPTAKGESFARIWAIDERTGRGRERMVTVFEHVPGRRIRPLAMKDQFIFSWGAFLARMHNATDGFQQTRTARRPNWDEIAFQREILSDDLRRRRWFRDEWDACQKWLQRLPQTEQGLIHADVHEGNFKVYRGEFYLFDFDDSCVCWYAYDLAVNLLRFASVTERDRMERFRSQLLAGYRSVRPLSIEWEHHIEGLIRVRRLWTVNWLTMRSDIPRLRRFYDDYLIRLRHIVANQAALPK